MGRVVMEIPAMGTATIECKDQIFEDGFEEE